MKKVRKTISTAAKRQAELDAIERYLSEHDDLGLAAAPQLKTKQTKRAKR